MKKIIKNRGDGKTTDLVKLSAEKQIPIIVHTNGNINYIKNIARELGLNIPNPIHISSLDFEKGMSFNEVLVDEADLVLQELLSFKINTLTMSPDNNT